MEIQQQRGWVIGYAVALCIRDKGSDISCTTFMLQVAVHNEKIDNTLFKAYNKLLSDVGALPPR